ncbi:putative aminoglycoside phosphotransferase [Polymorphobacter glacialis]|uniref:Aminoglycoside phosphotransferase n=1 Tax=Sandarakinorhabdus glacialis TaxID=1614636 RepID=A0A917E8N8_9SPHN|nr:phosphotransferase family protein [Polymorphobacter glacialis]GGE15068.1 putative aminoglycoside phosphotransferase [Polymorphobacter glacialis]
MDEIAILSRWLAAQGVELAPGTGLVLLGGGLANRNERIMLASGPAVLRRPPPGELAAGASDMGREFRVMSALSAHLPIVPWPLAFCDDPAVLGTPFLVLEYRAGVAIAGTMPEGAGAETGPLLVDATLAQMIALHALEPGAVGLGDLGKPEGFYARQLAGWTRRAAAVWPEGMPDVAARLIAALEAVAPPGDDAPVLLHMDLKPDNLLVDPVTMVPTAVIDWDMATRGPRGFDLAVLLSYWIEPGDPVAVQALRAVPSLTPGWPGRAAIAARYAALGGRDPGPLAWPLALARLRLAVAWGQLWRKWQRGEMVGDRYAEFETLALAILDHAGDEFRQDRI